MRTVKILAPVIGVFLFASPAFAQSVDVQAQIASLLAQIKQLQALLAQLQGQSGSSPACINLSYNLYADQTDAMTNGEVTKLQQFLAQDSSLYPSGLVTGYFGPMTEAAVQRWQAAHGVVSSGSPDTTGFGYVGPKTRMAMSCGGQTVPNDTSYAPPPVSSGSAATCAYTSGSTGTPRGIVFSGERTAESCKQLCTSVRNEVFGIGDSGSCEYKGANGIGHAMMGITAERVLTPTYSEPTCKYTSNSTGQVQGIAFNTDLAKTADNCKYICTIARNEKFGLNDPGICVYTGANGVGQSVMSILPGLATPSITLLSPNGGESFTLDQSVTIRWTASNVPVGGYYVIQFERQDGDRRQISAVATSNATISYVTYPTLRAVNTQLPVVPGTYKVSVWIAGVKDGEGASDSSDGIFSVVDAYVQPVTPTVTFQTSPNSILTGQSATLSWSATNANRCALQFGTTEIGGLPMSGTQVVLPSQTTSYRLICTNDPGTGKDGPSTEKTITVNVTYPTHVFNGSGVQINSGPNATAYLAAVNVVPGSSFTMSGTASVNGPLTVALVEIKYAGSTDWNSVGNVLKDGSGYLAVSNSAPVLNGNWSASFGGLPDGYYHILIYDASYNLKGSGFLVSTWKG